MLLIHLRPMLSQNWPFAPFTCRCQIHLMVGVLVVTSKGKSVLQVKFCSCKNLFSSEMKWHCFMCTFPQESRCWLTSGGSVEALVPLISDFLFIVEQIGVNAQQCEQIFAEGKIQWDFCYLFSLLLFWTFSLLRWISLLSIEVLNCSRM